MCSIAHLERRRRKEGGSQQPQGGEGGGEERAHTQREEEVLSVGLDTPPSGAGSRAFVRCLRGATS